MEYESKRRLRRCASVAVRLYAAAVLATIVYGSVWLLDLTGLVDRGPITSAWLAVLALGGVFAGLLVPVYRESRALAR